MNDDNKSKLKEVENTQDDAQSEKDLDNDQIFGQEVQKQRVSELMDPNLFTKQQQLLEAEQLNLPKLNPMQRALTKIRNMKQQNSDISQPNKRDDSWSKNVDKLLSGTGQNVNIGRKQRHTTYGHDVKFKKGGQDDKNMPQSSKQRNLQTFSPNRDGQLVIPDYETDESQKKTVEVRPSTLSNLPPRIPLEKVRSSSNTRGSGVVLANQQNKNNNVNNPFNSNANDQENAAYETILKQQLRNAPIKYCQAIYIYFEGDLKTKFHIHSLAPVTSQIEISKKPQLNNMNSAYLEKGEITSRKIDSFPDLQCAEALKIQGDIFRILPANDYNYTEKVRKILKSKKKFEPENQFKYGEYLESLNEEIKFNLDIFQNFKSQNIVFGSNVLFMHETSQQFLKISSPQMSDNSFQFKLKLSKSISEKTIFKIKPSNKLQQESDGKIHEYDQIYITYAYDKILMKDLCLFTDPDRLQSVSYKKTPKFGKQSKTTNNLQFNYQKQSEMVFSEDKKLPLHFGICSSLDYEHSDSLYRNLNGKIIQIKHVESEMYLSLTIRRKENKLMSLYFGDKNRYTLNQLIDFIPQQYSKNTECTINIHFEAKNSINTYWKVLTSPFYKDVIYLENAVSKVKLQPMHLQLIQRGGSKIQDLYFQAQFNSNNFFKFYFENEEGNQQAPRYQGLAKQEYDRSYLWVEYMKFIKTDNRYEFSKFGKINGTEDQGNFFDSFKIAPVEVFKQKSLQFISYCLNAVKTFDYYEADNDESQEYQKLYKVLKQLKKFIKNKLSELINVEEEHGMPNKLNQDLLKESYLLEEIIELMDFIWPDEHYLRKDFQFDDSVINSQRDPHKETKIKIAEIIFELILSCCYENLPIQEYTFFELIPSIQKFFGVGFRENQDYELFRCLVQNCDKYAEYKEKSKYSVIFQFIKKLFKEKSNEVKANIFQILRSFCLNSSGQPNNYHQKLLHDLFFFNKMENLHFTLKFGKTNFIHRASTFNKNISEQIIETGDQKNNQNSNLNRMLSERPNQNKSKKLMQLEEVKVELKNQKTANLDENSRNTMQKEDQINLLIGKEGINLIEHSEQEQSDNFIQIKQKETDDDAYLEDADFIIKQIHDLSFDNLSEEFLSGQFDNPVLIKIQLYFFADMCYLMNFECPCSHFTQKTVSNFIRLLVKGQNININIKAGLARVLNTILRNHNDNVRQHPDYLRMYQKQEFKSVKGYDIITHNDVRTLIKLAKDHFVQISTQMTEILTEYDSEIIRLISYLIQSDLIFSDSLQNGLKFIQDMFNNVSQILLNTLYKNRFSRRSAMTNFSTQSFRKQPGESTLNLEDFIKQFKKMKKIVINNLENSSQGMIENPIAWKSLNMQKQYISYVEKVIKKLHNKTSHLKNSETFKQQEKARHEMVKFYFWLINLRIDQLITNIINMFYNKLEKLINSNEIDINTLSENPQMITIKFLSNLTKDSEDFAFFEDILNYSDQDNKQGGGICDLMSMFNSFIQNYAQNKPQPQLNRKRSYSSDNIKQNDQSQQIIVERDVKLANDNLQNFEEIQSDKIQNGELLNTEQQLTTENEQKITQTENTEESKEQINIGSQNQVNNVNQVNILQKKQGKKQIIFLDILMDLFIQADDVLFQQEIIKVLFKCMTIRKEFLYHFQRTIVVFRSEIMPEITKIQDILSKFLMIVQDSTIWEIPKEADLSKNQNSPETKTIETLEDDISSTKKLCEQIEYTKSKQSIHSIKQEYVQKMKEHQKTQSQLFQTLAFTKSNKTIDTKLSHLEQFLSFLQQITEFFGQKQNLNQTKNIPSKIIKISGISDNESSNNINEFSQMEYQLRNQNLNEQKVTSLDDLLKQCSRDYLDQELSSIKSDVQYSFLALQGHEHIINFMVRNKELRQESIRVLFFSQKSQQFNPSGEVKHDLSEEQSLNQDRLIFAKKILMAFKKCYEILIKFIHNNHTNKQVLLNYLDDILLYNSEYYMQSKMIDEIDILDFDLLYEIISNNLKIRNMSTMLTPKIQSLVLYLHKIVEFSKKPNMFSSKILKVFSHLIANSDNTKINDLVVDIILREEEFFQIQGILLGNLNITSFIFNKDHFFIIEKFLKGIIGILRNQSIRMVKKKFYTIFNKLDNLQAYFDHLRVLLSLNIEYIKEKNQNKNSFQQDQLNQDGLFEDNNNNNDDDEDKEINEQMEEEISEISKRFLMIESYYIHIFYQLFFDIKQNQNQIQNKVDEMIVFLDHREKDLEIIEQYFPVFIYEEWAQYKELEESIDTCRLFCAKNTQKLKKGSLESSAFQFQTKQTSQAFSKKSSKQLIGDSPLFKHTTEQFHSNKSQQRFLLHYQERVLTNEEEQNSSFRNHQKIDNIEQNRTKYFQQEKQKNNKLTSNEKNEKKKEEIFLAFKYKVSHDEFLKFELKKEMNQFALSLLSKLKKSDLNSNDIEAQKSYTFFQKLIDYAHKNINKDTFEDIKMLIEVLSHFIDLTNSQQQYKGEGFQEKTQIQEKLNSVGAVRLLLELMCSDQSEIIDEIFPQLLLFANRILDGAQNNVQQLFTEYLTKNESSINLFQRCYQLIEKEIQILQKLNQDDTNNSVKYKRQLTIKDKTTTIMNKSGINQALKNSQFGLQDSQNKNYNKVINAQKQILKFLKNLCENHNTKLQLLVGNQQNGLKNFDMVSLTVNYLHSLISNINLSKRNYTNAQHCCIALAEYVQGPCFVNQNLIKDANFYHLAVQILQLKPHLIQNVKKQKDSTFSKNQQNNKGQKRQPQISGNKLGHSKSFNMFFDSEKYQEKSSDNQAEFELSNFMIQKLKLNCTIILLSLLEQRSADDPLLLSMKRSIPLDVIKQNIIYEYFLFCKDYNKFLSRENFFRHVLTASDDEVKEELIIEVGFNLFFLLKRWSENKKTNDSQLEEIIKLMQQKDVQDNAIVGTFKQFFEFIQYIKDSFKLMIKLIKKCLQNNSSSLHKRSSVEKFVSDPNSMQQALNFFRNNSGQIEVLINGSIEQVYFPYMPYCTYLSEEEKRDFYNNLPTDRDKEKIDALITDSIDLIRRMKIEYHFKKFFVNYPLVGAFVYYTELWKTLSFYTIIILNGMNLYSFTAANGNDRLESPMLFHYFSIQFTEFLYAIFGILQIIFAVCIDFTIISKRVVYHYELIFTKENKTDNQDEENQQNHIQEKQNQNENQNSKQIQNQQPSDNNSTNNLYSEQKQTFFSNWKKYGMSYFMSAMSDFILIYYIGYLIFSFCGYIFHPFFYCYHMIDIIIRNPYLKNVLKAIYRPRYELLNTFILFLCMEYIFSIWAYINFHDDFSQGECTSLSTCFMIIIDQTFKADGGLGSYMEKSYPQDMKQGHSINYVRFIFDNLFNVVLVILVVEIISGIIIDTFGALREEHNKITDSIENKCMICGKNRDQIEREHQDAVEEEAAGAEGKLIDEKAFDTHKNQIHNIYDYIFFLAYLVEKPELEYTGLESFVFEKYSEHNNTWFPIYKIGGGKGQGASDSHANGGDQNSDENEDDSGSQQESGQEDDNEGQQTNQNVNANKKNNNAGNNNQYSTILEEIQKMNNKIEKLTDSMGLDFEDNFNDKNSDENEELNRYKRLSKYQMNKIGSLVQSDKLSPKQSQRETIPRVQSGSNNNLFKKHRAKLLAISALQKKSSV